MRKRILVCSDSHGERDLLLDAFRLALQSGGADIAVFLGDGSDDYEAALPLLAASHIEAMSVRGNCDWHSLAPNEIEFDVNGVHFFATHGHGLGVKLGLERLWYTALEKGASVALYGHTHLPREELRDGVLLLNPGSIEDGCALTEILVEEDGQVRVNRLRWNG